MSEIVFKSLIRDGDDCVLSFEVDGEGGSYSFDRRKTSKEDAIADVKRIYGGGDESTDAKTVDSKPTETKTTGTTPKPRRAAS